jgi:hypothetical protein
VSQARTCGQCGAILPPGAQFCGSCGARVEPAAGPTQVDRPAPADPGTLVDQPVAQAPPPGTAGQPDGPPPPPPPPPQPASAPPPGGAGARVALGPEAHGLVGSLFDLSFTSFVTTKLIKILYVLVLVLIGLFYLVVLATLFDQSAATGVVWMLIIGPIVCLLWAIWARVLLEIAIVFFRIQESTAGMRSLMEQERRTR